MFAAAPYVSFLAPVAALSVGLPFIIGGAVFSALVFALSAAVISKNKTISERDAQLTEKDTKISSLKGQLAKKEKVKEKQKEILDCADLRNLLKEEKQGEILDSKALRNLFKEKPKLNRVVKKVEDRTTRVVKSGGDIAVFVVAMEALVSRLLPTPVCISVSTTGLSRQQTHLCQIDGNATVSLPFTQHVPTPQVVLENQIDEFSKILDNALESDKNNFGISQNSSKPQWYKDLDANICSANDLMDTSVSSLSSFTKVDNGINTAKYQGTLVDSVELSKLTREIPIQSQFVMAY